MVKTKIKTKKEKNIDKDMEIDMGIKKEKGTGKKSEELELAEQHIELAGQLILEESRSADDEDKELFKKAAFSLEEAQADLDESAEN